MIPGKTLKFCLLLGGFTLLQAAPPTPIVVNDDGGWCWFEDERVLLINGKLIVGSVASGHRDPQRRGNVEVTTFDLSTKASQRTILHPGGPKWLDDHNSPAFVKRHDGRLVAMYSRHGVDEKIFYRISRHAFDATDWEEERTFVPSPTSKVTYSNLHWLQREERIYDFFRGLHNSYKPSYAWSDDDGESWKAGNVFIDVPAAVRHRPYVKYASNRLDTVHITYTEGHPRDFDNSVYHIFYRRGKLHQSNGTAIRELSAGLKKPEEGTLVFRGDANNVAWVSDMHLDLDGLPVIVFSVQKDSAGRPPGQGGADHRYHYARWMGGRWLVNEIAHGGSRLYPGEDDYTGNIAIDPHDPRIVYISTNVEPVSGKALPSGHYEIFRGVTKDNGRRWTWTAVTSRSTQDNIRPVVPMSTGRSVLLWLRGKMTTYTDYRFEIVALP